MKNLLKTPLILKMLTICLLIIFLSPTSSHPEDDEFTVTMPGVTFTEDEANLCYFWKPPFTNTRYITSFEIIADSPFVHHILIYSCAGSLNESVYSKDCDHDCPEKSILFAWARNAPKMILPEKVGFELGSKYASIVRMEVHYRMTVTTPDHTALKMTITQTPQPFLASVGLYILRQINFPPNTKTILVSISCEYKDATNIVPFGFRTHTHTHGRVMTGYVFRKGKWLLIGKGNPLWPQAFWPVQSENLKFQKGDIIAVRAVYSTENETQKLQIGSKHSDEMCNYYIMYYRNATSASIPLNCFQNGFPKIVDNLPADANKLLPLNKTLDAMASMSHHHPQTHDNNSPIDEYDQIKSTPQLSISPTKDWPKLPETFKFGQVTGLSRDTQGFLYVFHRASIVWVNDIFDKNGNYNLDKKKPIKENTIVKIDSNTGEVVNQTGASFFYVPHGIFIDSQNFIWLTDIALQQVFKFSADIFDGGEMKPLLSLGTRFKPGFDQTHFCQPSDLLVSKKGEVFVSDGYCNKRIVVFDSLGKFLRELKIDSPSSLNPIQLPHSISLDEKNQIIYVASRKGLSVVVFKTSGTFVKKIKLKEFREELFAIHYNAATDKLFCVDGNMVKFKNSFTAHVFIIDPHHDTLISTWALPESFSEFDNPHDIVVSDNAHSVFVAILGRQGKVLKFEATTQNKQLGLQEPSYHRNLIHTSPRVENVYTIPNLTSTLLVVVCLMVIPLLIVIGAFVYIKNRQKINEFHYTQLRHQEGRNGVVGREGELKGLNVGSDDDDDEDDAFDASLFAKKPKT